MKVRIENARLSFPDLFEAVQYQGTGPFNYRCTLLVNSEDYPCTYKNAEGKTVKTTIKKVIETVAKNKWADKAAKILQVAPTSKAGICFVDGNTKEYDGYADKWALSATRPQDKGRPAIVDRDKTPLVAADGKPYGGCYVHASVEFWAQDNGHGKTIRCGLLGVQFFKDGDAFGGGSPADPNDFEELSVEDEEDLA